MPNSSYSTRNKPVLFFCSSLPHYLWFHWPLSLAPLYHFSNPRSSLFSFLRFEKALLHLWSSLPLVSLSSLVLQDEVIRTTQNLQNTSVQRFLQWCNEVCLLFSTSSLRFPNICFAFSITILFQPVFSGNYPQCLQHLFHDWYQHFKNIIMYM